MRLRVADDVRQCQRTGFYGLYPVANFSMTDWATGEQAGNYLRFEPKSCMKVAMKVVAGPGPTHSKTLLTCSNESYLIGRVHSDAKRATKIGDHLWRGRAHTLRWRLSAA